MKAVAIVDKLLEADPDEVDPRAELLRNDPAHDIKELIVALQANGMEVIGYNRIGSLVKMFIRIREWATEQSLEEWFEEFLRQQGVDISANVVASNLGFEGQGRAYKVFFPMEGPPVQYKELIKI